MSLTKSLTNAFKKYCVRNNFKGLFISSFDITSKSILNGQEYRFFQRENNINGFDMECTEPISLVAYNRKFRKRLKLAVKNWKKNSVIVTPF